MTLSRPLCTVLPLLLACGSTGGGGGGGGGGPPRENTATTLTLSGTRFFADYSNGVITTLPDGDVVLSALLADEKGYNSDLAVLRLQPPSTLKWAVRINENTVPSHVVMGREDSLFLIAGDSYPGSIRVLRLDADDGAVKEAVEYPNFTPGRALPLEDGGLLLAGGNLMRVDARLQPVWAKTIPAVHVLSTAEGFIAAGVPLGLGGRMSGIGLTRVSAEGQVAWRSFASPGPGNHSLAGLRALADGSLLVGLGNDSTRNDNVAALNPFLLVSFDAQGRLQKMSRAVLREQVRTSSGSTSAPLQFGGGYSLVPMGADTWMTFTANSGVLGSDVRTHVLARFSSDGALEEARYAGLHATSGPDGSTYSFSLWGPALSLFQVFPRGSGCVTAPTEAALSPVEGKTEYTEGSAVQVSDVRVMPKTLSRSATALSASLAPGCATP